MVIVFYGMQAVVRILFLGISGRPILRIALVGISLSDICVKVSNYCLVECKFIKLKRMLTINLY